MGELEGQLKGEEAEKLKTKAPTELMPMIWPESVRTEEEKKRVEVRGDKKCVVKWVTGRPSKSNTERLLGRPEGICNTREKRLGLGLSFGELGETCLQRTRHSGRWIGGEGETFRWVRWTSSRCVDSGTGVAKEAHVELGCGCAGGARLVIHKECAPVFGASATAAEVEGCGLLVERMMS